MNNAVGALARTFLRGNSDEQSIRSNSHRRLIVWALAGFGSVARAEPPSTNWHQFRGQHRNGVSLETGLLDSWPEGGPAEVWRHDLGDGFSAISVVDGRLYTMYADDAERSEDESPTGTEYAAAFDAESGEEIWRTEIGSKLFDEFGDGPKATPTVIGAEVFVLGGNGNFVSLSAADGSKNWEVDIKETFGSAQATYGFATSALMEGRRGDSRHRGGRGQGVCRIRVARRVKCFGPERPDDVGPGLRLAAGGRAWKVRAACGDPRRRRGCVRSTRTGEESWGYGVAER